jgi:hypothetical protein
MRRICRYTFLDVFQHCQVTVRLGEKHSSLLTLGKTCHHSHNIQVATAMRINDGDAQT